MASTLRRLGAASHPVLRRPGGWLLLGGVTLVHLLAADELVAERFGWGSAERPVPRIEVAFVRELQQAAPPAAPAPAAAARPHGLPAVAERAAAPASAAEALPPKPPEPAPAAPAPEPIPPPQLAEAPRAANVPGTDVQALPPAPEASAPAPAVAAAETAAAPPLPVASAPQVANFAWPPSTRLVYTLRGYYRGPLEGRAQVDWLRSGQRYQVHLETAVPPLLVRRLTSDGELTERGLAPRRFEGEQRTLLRSTRRWALQFSAERVVLTDGREVETLPGVQDEASQFVQLTWLFTTQPALLEVGRSIEVPLALNKRVDRWIYDVKERQMLQLPFGEVATYYVKPRREARPGEMTAEIWFAPTLQYLPVRIVIRTDDGAHVDLMLDRPPLQAAAEPGR